MIISLLSWQYPIIYIFWPSNVKEQKYVDARKSFELSDRNYSISIGSNRDSTQVDNEQAMREKMI